MSNNAEQNTKDIVIDMSYLREFSEGDITLEKKLIGLFAKQATESLAHLQTHCEQQNLDLWRDEAHKLKGTSISVGAILLSALCDSGQDLHGTLEEHTERTQQISEALAHTIAYFQNQDLLEA